MYRIFIGMFFHETNTFWPYTTGMKEFIKRDYYIGDEIARKYKGTRSTIGGFIDILEKHDVEMIYSVAAFAEPYGLVTAEAFEQIKDKLLSDLAAAGKVDGVLLGLHGAMVSEADEDGEGNVLEAVRNIVGPDVPVMGTIDLHANVTDKMIKNADVLIPYHEYPHVDIYDRALYAAEIMMKTLNGEMKPVMCYRSLPLLATLVETKNDVYRPLMDACDNARKQPGMLEASLLHGFFTADIADAGVCALTISDGDEKLAQKAADELAALAWEHRDILVKIPTYTPEEAIAEAAQTEGTVVFADICDNPGAGSSSDGTKLLHALLDAGVTNVACGMINDPETVEQCHAAGVGSYIDVKLGGKFAPDKLGAPIERKAYVKTLSDGRYIHRGPMHAGTEANVQKSAVIVIDGITIVVSAVARQAYDIEVFQSHGLTLKDFKILVVKSSVHYRAAFGPHAAKMLSVECPGVIVINPKDLDYKNVKRPICPLDEGVKWVP